MENQMVTEQTPSSNEASPVEQAEQTISANDNIDAGAEYFGPDSTTADQETGAAAEASTDGVGAVTETKPEPDPNRMYSSEEFSKMQSAEQRQKNDLAKELQDLKGQFGTLQEQQQQAQMNSVQQHARNYARDILYPQLVEQGYGETEAMQKAEAQAGQEMDTLMRTQQLQARESALNAQQNQIVTDSKRVYVQKLNTQYGIPPNELNSFETPEQMEQYARLWSKTNQSQQQVQNSYRPLNTAGDTTPDAQPTDDQSTVERYAAGDSNISYQQYQEANRRLWGS
jgi:hypothetical protein